MTEQAATDNDVTIAAIEADTSIQIAQIEADARVAVEESYNEARVAEAEAQSNQDNELWATINRLASQVETLTVEIQTLKTMETMELQAQPSLEEVTEEVAEAVSETLTENDLTQVSTSPLTSETPTEVSAESEEESQALLPPLLEVDRKPIIRLV